MERSGRLGVFKNYLRTGVVGRSQPVLRYVRSKGTQLITVDIYEMGSPLDAYGYYSYQLSPSARSVRYVNVGAQGYQTRDGLNFWKGPYYVNVIITAANAPVS